MRRMLPILVLLVFSSLSHAVLYCKDLWADPRLRSDTIHHLPGNETGPGFIIPNETKLGLSKAEFENLSEGIYLTVGTERGLMSSALSGGKVKALIQVDREEKIVLFNRINRALLAVSVHREHYLNLRLHSSHKEWLTLIRQTKEISAEDRQTLLRKDLWQWWQDNVRALPGWEKFHQNPEMNSDRSYIHANYLFDDVLFAHVASLAKQQRILIVHDSLGTETFQERVNGISEALGLKLSAIDMSNAWQEGYLGHQNTLRFLESLSTQMKAETRFIFTYMVKINGLTSSAFRHMFTRYAESKEIGQVLVNMAWLEPIQNNEYRSRANRYDGF